MYNSWDNQLTKANYITTQWDFPWFYNLPLRKLSTTFDELWTLLCSREEAVVEGVVTGMLTTDPTLVKRRKQRYTPQKLT